MDRMGHTGSKAGLARPQQPLFRQALDAFADIYMYVAHSSPALDQLPSPSGPVASLLLHPPCVLQSRAARRRSR